MRALRAGWSWANASALVVRAGVGALAAWGASCGGSGSGEDSIGPAAATATVVDGYTLVASKAVAVDATGALFAGAGGGILLLQHAPPPALEPLTLVAPETVGTRGMVLDLAATDDYVYAATWKNGLVVVRRSDATSVHVEPFVGTEGAWSVAVLDASAGCGAKRIVVIGTREPLGPAAPPAPTGGRLLILEHDLATDALELRESIDVGSSVECVAASAAIAPPPSGANVASFSVLLGADCATLGGASAYLQRRDFSYACVGGSLAFTEDGARGWPGQFAEPLRIVRDIAIDEARGRAYVAAYFHGVLAFDVAQGELAADTSPGWPLLVDDGAGNVRLGHANALALDPAPEPVPGLGARLVVGWGPKFESEWQYFGDSSRAECATSPAVAVQIPVQGVRVYRLDANDDPQAGPFGALEELAIDPPPPADFIGVCELAVERYGSPTSYYVYAALDTRGVAVVRAEQSAGTWSASVEASWDHRDPGLLPLTAHDDALVLADPLAGDFLYVATEESIAVFDLAGRLSDARCVNSSGQSVPAPCSELGDGVTLAGFPNPNGRLVAATIKGVTSSPGGLRVYDVSTPELPFALDPELDKGGRGFAVAAAAGAWSGTQPADADRARWVFTTQSDGSDPSASFTVKLFDLGTQNDPHDPGCVAPCTPAALLATWQDAPQSDLLEGIAVQEVAGGEELAVYVPYSVNADSSPSMASARAGVVVLRVTLDGAQQPHFTKVQKTSAFVDVDATFKAGRATFDAAKQRLYVCWGTGGIASYDASAPYSLAAIAKRDLRDEYGDYHQRLSPTQMVVGPSGCGSDFLYVAFLNDGVGVIDVASDLAGPITILPVRSQAISITLDPADPTRRTLFVSGGRAGIDKLVVEPCNE